MSSCERPSNTSASAFSPSSVSKRYSFSTFTHGSSRRCRASSSPRLVCSFSRMSSSSRAASHSSRVPMLCSVNCGPFRAFLLSERWLEHGGVVLEPRPPRARCGLDPRQTVEALLPTGGVARGSGGRQLVDQDEPRAVILGDELESQRVFSPG